MGCEFEVEGGLKQLSGTLVSEQVGVVCLELLPLMMTLSSSFCDTAEHPRSLCETVRGKYFFNIKCGCQFDTICI